MAKIVIDATDSVLGRVGSYAAKELLKGNSVEIINSEKVIISGRHDEFVAKVRAKRNMGRGASIKGPKIDRKEDRMLKRIIRGMLPWDRPKGREAHKQLRCHIGSGDLSAEDLKTAKSIEMQKPRKFTTLKEVVRSLK
jgi:large subunit ribosomal protein L13